MGNTFFYRQVKSGGDEITWKDIFSECRRKHTRQELEYALSAGTSMNQVSEADMLKKWQKPWVFYPLRKGGLLLVFLTYLILFATIFITGIVTTGLVDMVMIIPPIVIPFILLIFIWELNIPKNISIYELLAYFVFGGLLSFALTAFMYVFVGDGPGIFAASTAALREEPAKLFAAVILLLLFPKNKKIYGLTGLVVGAAVGAGFGGFESVEYAFMIQGEGFLLGAIYNQIIRGIFALGGHVLYCAPYVGALALAAQRGRIGLQCFLDRDFLLLFAASTGLHFLWNADMGGFVKYILIIVVLWVELLYVVKKCLYQVVQPVQYKSSGAPADIPAAGARGTAIQIAGLAGPVKGMVWRGGTGDLLTIGRGEGCRIRVPQDTRGISRNHCTIRFSAQGWVLVDDNSTYGTFLGNGYRLLPGKEQKLNSGDVICLGGKENAFRIIIL